MQQIDLSAMNDTESIYRLIGNLMQDNREFQVMITVPSKDREAKQAAATTASNKMSEKVYNATVKMYKQLQTKTGIRNWFKSLVG